MGTYLFGALSKHMAYTYMEQQAQLKKRFEDKKTSPNLIFNKNISVYFNRKLDKSPNLMLKLHVVL